MIIASLCVGILVAIAFVESVFRARSGGRAAIVRIGSTAGALLAPALLDPLGPCVALAGFIVVKNFWILRRVARDAR